MGHTLVKEVKLTQTNLTGSILTENRLDWISYTSHAELRRARANSGSGSSGKARQMRLTKNVIRSENSGMPQCEGVMTLILMNEPSVFELPDSIRLKRTCYLQRRIGETVLWSMSFILKVFMGFLHLSISVQQA